MAEQVEPGDGEDFKAGESEWGQIFAGAREANEQREAESKADRRQAPIDLVLRAYHTYNEMGEKALPLIEALKSRPETVRSSFEGYSDTDLHDLGLVLETVVGQEMSRRKAA